MLFFIQIRLEIIYINLKSLEQTKINLKKQKCISCCMYASETAQSRSANKLSSPAWKLESFLCINRIVEKWNFLDHRIATYSSK